MQNNLLVAGIACMIAALIGGGLKAFTIEIPLLGSVRRQIFLGLFGAILMALSFVVWRANESAAPPVPTPHRNDASLASPSPPPPAQQPRVQEISLVKSSFFLPDDDIEMKNAKVGPFCCTGNVVIVRSGDGGTRWLHLLLFMEGSSL